jgi:UDP-N-acetylmuramate: L-alanyl-gamma-D-glutamyl-meso-diaminopimelate ligase
MQTINSLRKNIGQYKKIFFFRICGTGMGAAACLLREAGFDVEGGDDNFYPPMSDYLTRTGIKQYQLKNISEKKLQEYDLIVVGNVVPRGSDDAKAIERCGVAYCSFPAALGAFVLSTKHVIGIAGTHGKTTTSYYLTQMLEKLGEDPGYLIGGVIENRPSSTLGKSKYFVIESDEYDSAYFEKISKFRSYCLDDVILTSLEYDHADIFNSVEDIKDEFRELFKTFSGKVVFDSSYKASQELANELKNIEWHGYNNELGPEISEASKDHTLFKMNINKSLHTFKTNIIGTHNILNIAGCIRFCIDHNFSLDKINDSIKSLKHVKRRQEKRGTFQEATVIDDFAHHPKSVDFTIDAIRTQYAQDDQKVIVVLEPNSATARSDIFQNEFSLALEKADSVILARAERNTTAKNADNLDYERLVGDLNSKGTPAVAISELDSLMSEIKSQVTKDTILLILSNGTCLGLWKTNFLDPA